MSEQNISNQNYLDILELRPDASFAEIKSAYAHLKKLYSSESVVFSPIVVDISSDSREKLLEQIEEAYQNLKEQFLSEETEKQTNTRDRVIRNHIPEFEVFSGTALKLTREVLKVELQEIALATGIPLKHLKSIELERFDLLPPPGYIRIYVAGYAEYLSLDAKRVADDYMKTYFKIQESKNKKK